MAYNSGGGQPPYNPQPPYNAYPPPQMPPPKSGMGTGAKVALFGCLALILLGIVAAIVGGVIFVAYNKNSNELASNSRPSNTSSSTSNTSSRSTSPTNDSSASPTSGVHVDSIKLARDDNGAEGDEVESFHPKDNPMHVIVQLSEFEAGTKIRIVLMAVQVDSGERNQKVAEVEKETGSLQNELNATFTLPRDWPTGTYRVDTFVNDKLDKARTFQVVN